MEQVSNSLIYTKIYGDVPIEIRIVNPTGYLRGMNKDWFCLNCDLNEL